MWDGFQAALELDNIGSLKRYLARRFSSASARFSVISSTKPEPLSKSIVPPVLVYSFLAARFIFCCHWAYSRLIWVAFLGFWAMSLARAACIRTYWRSISALVQSSMAVVTPLAASGCSKHLSISGCLLWASAGAGAANAAVSTVKRRAWGRNGAWFILCGGVEKGGGNGMGF